MRANSLKYGPLVLAFAATLAAAGSTEAQSEAAINGSWSSHWEYTFDDQTNEIRGSERARASDISSYMDRNPSLRIGLDGSTASVRSGGSSSPLLAAQTPQIRSLVSRPEMQSSWRSSC
jgi:hypothetical protein